MKITRQPAVGEAVQFAGDGSWYEAPPAWLEGLKATGALRKHPMFPERMQLELNDGDPTSAHIIDKDDWVVIDEEGNLAVLKPEEFEATYTAA